MAKKTAKNSRLQELSQDSQFLDLQLISCASRRGGTPPDQLEQSISITPGKSTTEPKVKIIVSLSIGAVAGDEQTFKVEAQFGMMFAFSSLGKLSNNDLEQFAQTVGLLVVWPYWRELVQSLTARMGLPLLRVPLIRPQNLRLNWQQSASKTTANKPAKKRRRR